jgi:hypothetical protein
LRELWAADTLKPVDYGSALWEATITDRPQDRLLPGRELDGRWMMVDPHGHPFFSAGMDLVGYKQEASGPTSLAASSLFQRLPEPGPAWLTPGKPSRLHREHHAPVRRRMGEEVAGPHRCAAEELGFNTVANWSDYDVATTSRMPYVIPLQGWTTRKVFPFPWNFPDVFSKEFRDNVDQAARRQLTPPKDDPNLIGWFIGNEPQWARSFGSLTPWPDMLLADPEPSATKARLEELLKANPGREQQVKDDFLYTCAEE